MNVHQQNENSSTTDLQNKGGRKNKFRISIKKPSKKYKSLKQIKQTERCFQVDLNSFILPNKIPDPPKKFIHYLAQRFLSKYNNSHSSSIQLNDLSNIKTFSTKIPTSTKKRKKKIPRNSISSNPWLAFRSYYSRRLIGTHSDQHHISSILAEHWSKNTSERDAWASYSFKYKEENNSNFLKGIQIDDFRTWLNHKYGFNSNYTPVDQLIAEELKKVIKVRNETEKKITDAYKNNYVEDVFFNSGASKQPLDITSLTKKSLPTSNKTSPQPFNIFELLDTQTSPGYSSYTDIDWQNFDEDFNQS